MPGQLYHYSMGQMALRKGAPIVNWEKFTMGNLVLDSLNDAGGRRASHFCGGAGIVIPKYEELQTCTEIQHWDSSYQKSTFVDPMIDFSVFKSVIKHLPQDDFIKGIEFHLWIDYYYDIFIQKKLFELHDDKAILKSTGETMNPSDFRSNLYKSYPMLDMINVKELGITADEVTRISNLLKAKLIEERSTFIIKYLNYISDYKWEDTDIFKYKDMEELVQKSIVGAISAIW